MQKSADHNNVKTPLNYLTMKNNVWKNHTDKN